MDPARPIDNSSERSHNPAVFWLLIITMMLMLAGAIKVLGNSSKLISKIPLPTPSELRGPRFYTVSYKSGVFSPTNLRIHAGDTVRFKNEGFFNIRIVSDPQVNGSQIPVFDSVGDIPQGSYFSYTFAEKGTFGYHNNTDEQGTIIVR